MTMPDHPTKAMLAFDLGAESGHALLGWVERGCLLTDEIRRFPNDPIHLPDGLHWNLLQLFQEIKRSISEAVAISAASDMELVSIGIDSWGVDYGLLDQRGGVLGMPYHYRDLRSGPMMARAHERMSELALYTATGVRSSPVNTLFQLLDDQQAHRLEAAKHLLMIPDLLGYWLTGTVSAEMTNASTTQIFDPDAKRWSEPVIEALNLPRSLFPPVVEPGTRKGAIAPYLSPELGMSDLPVINVASHDTASAFAAAGSAPGTMMISAGTWFLVGEERAAPIRTEAALANRFTNELGVNGRVRFIRNCCGLWLLQEVRREWSREGPPVSYANLTERGAIATPLQSLIDPEDPRFYAPDRMVACIAEACAASGEPVPDSTGAMVRCIVESLAFSMRRALDCLETVTGETIERVTIVGGGAKSSLLCQSIADATNRPTIVEAVESTAIGNLLVQSMANGLVSSLDGARALLPAPGAAARFEPTTDRAPWEAAYARFLRLAAG